MMEVVGGLAAVLQLSGLLIKGLDKVIKVYRAVKNQPQQLQEFEDELRLMRTNLISVDEILQEVEKAGVQFSIGLGPEDIKKALNSAEKAFLDLLDIFNGIKNKSDSGDSPATIQKTWEKSASTIKHLRARMSTFATFTQSPLLHLHLKLAEHKKCSHYEQFDPVVDYVIEFIESISELEDHVLKERNETEDEIPIGWTRQKMKDIDRDSSQLIMVSRSVLRYTTETSSESLRTRNREWKRKRNRDSHCQDLGSTYGRMSMVSHSSVYNSVSQAQATMSLLGVPLSNRERQDISDWRDHVIPNGSRTRGTSHLKSGSRNHSEQITSVSPPSQKKQREVKQKTSDSVSASPVEPLNVYCEQNTIVKAAMHIISPDFEDMYMRIAQIFKNRMGSNQTAQWAKEIKQQLLYGTNTRESKALGGRDTWMLFEAIFRTTTDSSIKATLNPFISSPLLNEVRFNEGKKLYQRGNLVTAAPLLILCASNERQRGEMRGIYQQEKHVCRPETEKSLLCGKLLCQLDPFSNHAPESLYCSSCEHKSAWPSSWPWLPQFFAFLSLDKYVWTTTKLDNDFYSSAKSAVLQFASVMDHMAEDTMGTLAVASAVMQLLVRKGKAEFDTSNIPLGLYLTWQGTLPYFRSQQNSMLALAKSSSEKAANVGIELLRKQYRRISFTQQLNDRQDPPVLYDRIRSMLVKNGGKLWGSENSRCSDSPVRYPVIELLVTCTPRLQWGVFGAADEIYYLLRRIRRENPLFGWSLEELSYLIRQAIMAGNPMAVAILMQTQKKSHRPMNWPLLFQTCIKDLQPFVPGIDVIPDEGASWQAVEATIHSLPLLSVPEAFSLTEADAPFFVQLHLFLRLTSLIIKLERILKIVELYEMVKRLRRYQAHIMIRRKRIAVDIVDGKFERNRETVVRSLGKGGKQKKGEIRGTA
ncbi:hypothetical protein FGADI_12213 [Fusarium gaditjirri]|uniref:Uncharacterized protein n=1 Tax=Fusarium gaditjirri TaxID=282569 RepID=A0A8H4WPI0_9HYPO|nr:hypothetical protein FGADI_12213 [Fusarium gaditjirri]